jgi:hypothetical protein
MRNEIEQLLADLAQNRQKLRSLIQQTHNYPEDRWGSCVQARVDLKHADTCLHRAEGMISRLVVNGIKPWDVEMAQ